MKIQKNNKILVFMVFFAALMLVIIVLFLKSDGGRESSGEATEVSAESAGSSAESDESSAENGEAGPAELYKEGEFTFTAGEFRERFMDTLPEGYMFAEAIAANPLQDDNMQLDILDATGMSTNIAVLLNTKEAELTCSQMALIINEDGYKEDAAAILEWYLSTFLDSFEPEERSPIMEEYLNMFDSRTEEYRVYSSDFQVLMMNRVVGDFGRYYYVMLSIQ